MSEQLKNPETENEALITRASELLKQNEQEVEIERRDGDKEKILVRPPDKGYYEGNWLWDTGFNELGASLQNPEKSAEIFLNFLGHSQWKNGLVPHILFYKAKPERYFPGPKYWKTENSPDAPDYFTSGITQPPVLGFCALRIYESLKEKTPEKAESFVKEVYPRILNFHRYLFRERDPEKSGLVSIYHPWEAGLDNSPRWEDALSKISVSKEQLAETRKLRRDIKGLVAKEMRPTDEDYARYLYLFRFAAERNYNDKKVYPEIPFNVKDVLFNSILYASNEALYLMAEELNDEKGKSETKEFLQKQRKGFEELYDKDSGLYYDLNTKTGALIKRKTVACFTPMFAGVTTMEQAQKMAEILKGRDFQGEYSEFLIPSTARSDPSFHSKAYWRGPIWLPTNWLVIRGLERMGLSQDAEDIKKYSLELVKESGFAEYYNPDTNEPLGRGDFSWTASLAIDFAKGGNYWQKIWNKS